jgi:hypothetical protein
MQPSFDITTRMTDYWKVKARIIPGKSYAQVNKIARSLFHDLERRTKRKPYIRSKYFKKQKVFLSFFWEHLGDKTLNDKTRRLKLFECCLDLIKNSPFEPTTKVKDSHSTEILYRFYGSTKGGELFAVQIKKNKKGRLELMSVFPWEK